MSYIPALEGVIDSTNSTVTPLGGAGVFTGVSIDVTEYATISINSYADEAGQFEAQFSSDGTNWDIIEAFETVADASKTQTIRVPAAFMRVVYTNGAVAQTIFRLQTILNVNKTPTPLPFLGLTTLRAVSTDNSSVTPLGGSATFTGTGETSIFNTLLVSCTADVAGTIYVDYSPDDGVWVSSSFSGYRIEASIPMMIKEIIKNTYYRVRLVNGVGAQTSLDLVSITGTFDEEYLTSFQQIIRKNTGLEADISIFANVGYQASLSTTFQDIWGTAGVMTLPTGAETYELVFADANDTAGGTGAEVVYIETLDTSGIVQSQVVVANGGTATVTGSHTFPRVMIVVDSGSNFTNVGDITLQVAGGGAVRSVLEADTGKTLDSHYKVPSNVDFHITGLDFHTGVSAKEVVARSRIMLAGTNTWVSTSLIPFGSTSFTRDFDEASARFPANTIIKYDAKLSSGSGDDITIVLAGIERRIS